MPRNITLAIDDLLLRKVRVYAAERGTTVNALVRDHLEALVAGESRTTREAEEEDRLAEVRARLRDLMNRSEGAEGGPPLSRDEIYADRLFPRHKHSRVRSSVQEE